MRECEQWIPTLAPPTGGLLRLRRHIQAHDHRPRMRWLRVAVPAAAILTATFVVMVMPWLSQRQRDAALVSGLRQAVSAPATGASMRVVDGAALELPSGQAHVRLYLVERGAVAPASPERASRLR